MYKRTSCKYETCQYYKRCSGVGTFFQKYSEIKFKYITIYFLYKYSELFIHCIIQKNNGRRLANSALWYFSF